ncbi:MAG: hypothetical protein LBE13_18620 [Bacteroidales bacterium]|jgi:methyl-accepting chemotaxis protein|nr:hypothetical protein [Bacteroidales bacterium]
MFSFAKLEAIQEEIESTTSSSETESKVDELDISEDVKDEIKDIIEEAVGDVVETIEEGNSASDEVAETTTQLDETTEQTENLMLLYDVIKEHGISKPILALCDTNGSFRQACRRNDPSVSFESLTITPSFGIEQKVALETIKESLSSAWETVKKLIAKVIIFIKNLALKIIDVFRNKAKIIKSLSTALDEIKDAGIDNELLKFSVPMTGKQLITYLEDFKGKFLTTEFDETIAEFKTNIPTTDEDFKSRISSVIKDSPFTYDNGKLSINKKEFGKGPGSHESGSGTSFGPDYWSLSQLKSINKNINNLANEAVGEKKQTEKVIKALNDFKDSVGKKNDETSKKQVPYASKLISFVSKFISLTFKYNNELMTTYITVARAYLNAYKKPKDKK